MRTVVDPTTSVRAILTSYPETAPVFEHFGLSGCGGSAGPDEPLDFFARVHHVPLDALLTALTTAIEGRRSGDGPEAPAGSTADAQPAPTPASHQFAPFVLAALGVTLTLGATLGMVNLARLTGTWGSLARTSVWAHAYAQVFGFVGLFVMGIAYHVVPRFLGRSLSRGTSPTLVLQLAGVLVLCGSYFLPDGPWTRPVRVAAALALIAASGLFASHIIGIVRSAPRSHERFEPWLIAGATWLVVASTLAAIVAVTADETWHHLLWPIGLFGFAGSWIFGVARRILPVFLGWRTRWPKAAMPILVGYQSGVVAWSLGAWPDHGYALALLRGIGAVLLVASVVAFTMSLGITWRRGRASRDPHSGYEPYVRAAWVWLYVALATGPIWTLGALSAGRYGAVLMLDFSSHALALGFVTQMIIGVSMRVLPVFTGHTLWSPRSTSAVFWLLNTAVAVRGLQAVNAAGYWSTAWSGIAYSGPLAVAAILLFSINTVMTLRGGQAPREPSTLPPDLADAIVGDLLAHDGVLKILIDAGFAPLASPMMRATFARSITLGQACRLRGVPLEPLAHQIEPLVRGVPHGASRSTGPTGRASRRIDLTVVPSDRTRQH